MKPQERSTGRIAMLAALLLIIPLLTAAKTVSPNDYGLRQAKTDIERYEVLLRTHTQAAERGWDVSYVGIGSISIEIPREAKSIPLAWHTDFGGVRLTVKNVQKKMTLFTMENSMAEVQVSGKEIDKGRFRKIKELRRGTKLLVIEDENMWVKQRKGYNYGATRKDVMAVKRGKAQNGPVSPYMNAESRAKCYYCDVTGQRTVIENLRFERTADSRQITHLLVLKNLNDVTLRNISVITPQGSDLYGDVVIGMQNCTNVTVEDVTIDGTYSQSGKFGYGIQMNNVWNSRFVRLKATGKWGVFGNNNVNRATLEECDINRFDIHCYGRDVYCRHTTFRKGYNQFSSMMGELVYEDCVFDDFVPVLFEQSYSAYTPFQLFVKNCRIMVRKSAPYLVSAGSLVALSEEARDELRELSWPDVRMENVEVVLPEGVKEWTIFNVKGNATEEVGSIEKVTMRNVRIETEKVKEKATLKFSNVKAMTKKTVKMDIKGSSVESIEF